MAIDEKTPRYEAIWARPGAPGRNGRTSLRAARSPLSVEAFCRGEGVSTASFYNWRKRLGGAAPDETLPPVATREPAFLDLGLLGASADTASA